MQITKILLTSVGGLVAPGMIKNLKKSFNGKIYIVGVDIKKEAVGFYFVDKSYVVSSGKSRKYSSQLLEIAKKEKIDVIIPLSDEEVLILSKNRKMFNDEGVKIACSDYQAVKNASDKGLLLQYLEKNNIPCAKYRLPKSIDELHQAAYELGYPEKKIVFKPRTGRGARGFWLLDANLKKGKMILESRDRQEITLEWLAEGLASVSEFPKIVLMEYLPGKDFNVDVLASQGKPLYIIPNERIMPKAGPVQVGLIKQEEKVKKMVSRAVEAFGFDYCVNVELAYNDAKNSVPLIYEINARVSAPIVANKAAGVDLLKMGIELALGREIKKNKKFKTTKMIRYWSEILTLQKQWTQS